MAGEKFNLTGDVSSFDDALRKALTSDNQGERSLFLDKASNYFVEKTGDIESLQSEIADLKTENERLLNANTELFNKYSLSKAEVDKAETGVEEHDEEEHIEKEIKEEEHEKSKFDSLFGGTD